MSYTLTLTTLGQQKILSAITSSQSVTLSTVGVGSSATALTVASTQLGQERFRATINSQAVVGSTINFVVTIPVEVGGWYMRELGVFDVDGTMIAFSQFPETYKPLPSASDVGVAFSLSLALNVINASAVNVEISDGELAAIDPYSIVGNFLGVQGDYQSIPVAAHIRALVNSASEAAARAALGIASLTVDAANITGQLTAAQIDTRNLTIRDGAGNVIFGVAQNLDWSRITAQPAGIFNSNITINANGTLSGAGSGQVTIAGLDSSVVRSANPITAANIATYIAAAAIGDAYIGNLSANKINAGTLDAARIAAGSLTADKIDTRGLTIKDDSGNIIFSAGQNLDWARLANQPSGIFNSNIAINANGTLSGAGGGQVTIAGLDSSVVRSANPITAGNIATYIAAAAIGDAYIANLSANKITTGTLDAARIAAGSITADKIDTRSLTIKDASGNVIFSAGQNLDWARLANQPSNIYNANIAINANGTLSGAGGGQVTIAGLDSTVIRSANPITSANIATYIAAAAIGDAYIGNLSADKINAGTLAAARIAAGSITADKLSVSTLSAITANIGTVTAGSIDIGAGSSTARVRLQNGLLSQGFFTTQVNGFGYTESSWVSPFGTGSVFVTVPDSAGANTSLRVTNGSGTVFSASGSGDVEAKKFYVNSGNNADSYDGNFALNVLNRSNNSSSHGGRFAVNWQATAGIALSAGTADAGSGAYSEKFSVRGDGRIYIGNSAYLYMNGGELWVQDSAGARRV